ncbi:sugar transferase [Parapedobacter sp. 2B3]|uniref:sugar transferase n=1 Tax=Parapedobacter sp. 2B3 TaxID=3342381 RepID=UPI0035B612BE
MYPTLKRLIDIIASLGVILILSPVMLIIAVLVKLQDGGPALFKQKRVGRNGKEFIFLKFRSMPVATPNVESSDVKKLTVTPLGKVIRRTNLDELPQLFNILKGDMSLIGPRPPIPAQTGLVALRSENGALALRPGLTGWAQVNSYDFMPEEEKARFDGDYAQKLSLWMDIRVVLRTLVYLTKRPPTY